MNEITSVIAEDFQQLEEKIRLQEKQKETATPVGGQASVEDQEKTD